MIITNAVVLTQEKEDSLRFIETEQARIQKIAPVEELPSASGKEIIDAHGGFVGPGLIDTHTHGGFGVDYAEITPEGFSTILESLPKFGTTAVLGTIGSTSFENLVNSINAAKTYLQSVNHPATQFLGFHIEGPFINRDQSGAQDRDYIQNPDLNYIKEIIELADGLIRIVTLAPELPNAMGMIRYLVEEGVVVSIGHSSADPEVVFKAIKLGATRATHLFNCMSPLHHRKIGVVGAVLHNKTISAEMVLDGFHVDPIAAKLAYDLKGPDHIILMTDATHLVGLPEGEYQRPGKDRKVLYADGAVWLVSNGRLAGSVLTMDQAFRNAMAFLDVDPFTASKLASTNPARTIGLDHMGTIDVGKQADFVVFDQNFNLKNTIIKGKMVYEG